MSLRRSGRHVSGLQVAVINSSGPSLRACKVVADVWDTKCVQPHRNERLPPSFSFKHPCLQSQVEPEEWTRMVFWRRWIRWWFLLWRRFLLRRLFLWKRWLKLREEDGKKGEHDGDGNWRSGQVSRMPYSLTHSLKDFERSRCSAPYKV